jgi:hypothetical protein
MLQRHLQRVRMHAQRVAPQRAAAYFKLNRA